MASLIERMKKIGHTEMVKLSDTIDRSVVLNNRPEIVTDIPAINIALSGEPDRGMTSGILMIAGPSKHFKTLYGLIVCAAYMKKHEDAVMIFYDNEGGGARSYFESVGIDPSRVLHVPFSDIESLRSDAAQKLSATAEGAIKRGEHAIIFIDSIGNAASSKEIRDAENEHGAADMTRAKTLKSFWRVITSRLMMLDIPLVAINHTYSSQGMYPTDVVSGGSGGIYGANDIWIIGKSQIKDEEGLAGFRFTIKIEKSRRVKEKSKIPIDVTYRGGISKYTGLLDMAQDVGIITKPVRGRYTRQLIDRETGEIIPDRNWLMGEIEEAPAKFFEPLLTQSRFPELIKAKYQAIQGRLLGGGAEEPADEDLISAYKEDPLQDAIDEAEGASA